MTGAGPGAIAPDRRGGSVDILMIWLAGLGSAAQYGKVSVVFGPLSAAYPDSGVALGFTVSAVGVVGLVFGVVAGVLVSRAGYRRTLVFALWLGAACSAFQAALPPMPLLLVSRVVEGASHLGIVVAAPTLIAELADDARRPFYLSVWSTFFGVAFAILALVGIPLAASGGIGALFAAHGVWMAGFAILLAWRLPDPVVAGPPQRLSAGRLVRRTAAVYRAVPTVLPAAGWVFYTLAFVSALTLLPPFLNAGLRQPLIAAMPLLSIAVSLTLGVWLLRRMPATRVMTLGFAAAAMAALALVLRPGDAALCLALAGAFGLVQGATFAAVPQLNVTPDDRSAANGGLAQAGNLGNTLGTPLLLLAVGIGGWVAFAGALAATLAAGAAAVALLSWRGGS